MGIRLGRLAACFFMLASMAAVAGADEAPVSESKIPQGSAVGEWSPRGDTEEPALTINEPMYVVVGRDASETLARFQFSFKYRIFDADGVVVQQAPWLARLHMAYTQTSLWNLSADSKPFEDSSYRPSFFWEFQKSRTGLLPDQLRAGYEHESNGQGGKDSRSLDTFFLWPAWETRVGGTYLAVAPKLYLYLDQEEGNDDIEDYRGYADLNLRFGDEEGWLASVLWRYGMKDRNTVQLDLSYPIRKRFFARAGGYFFLQAFHGYGESLLTYNQQKDLVVRVGFAIVR